MDGGGQLTQAFPRPGPALKVILALVAVLGIGFSLVTSWGHGAGGNLFGLLVCTPSDVVQRFQVWRLLTAGLLTNPRVFSSLIFTLIGLYFLSVDLERRWGTWRFVRFVVTATVLGYALAVALAYVTPASWALFHPPMMFGSTAVITAAAIAWSRANAGAQVRLFLVVPVSTRVLFWLTIGFCCLGLVNPDTLSEGAIAPFGGVLTGLLYSGRGRGSLYTTYLRIKLAILKRRAGHTTEGSGLHSIEPRGGDPKRKRGGPPLRVVYGGLEEELKKRKPPKDKRYLN